MTTTNLTANEAAVLHNIATNDFAPLNGDRPTTFAETGPVWSNCLGGVPSGSIPGVVASLSKKGLVTCSGGRGDEATVSLTEEGFAAWLASGK